MLHIKSLFIEDFRILNGFEINFEKPISMLIGINGSGKTTILEVLSKIFSNLYGYFVDRISIEPNFNFTIVYEITFKDDFLNIDSNTIEVTASYNQTGFNLYAKNDSYESHSVIDRLGYDGLFPNVVVYYSGFSKKLADIGRIHELRYNKELANPSENSKDAFGKVKPLPIMYVKDIHFDILLASLFALQYDEQIDVFFNNDLGIYKPQDRTIIVYIKRKRFRKNENYDYSEFGGAPGEIFNFLNVLREKSNLSPAVVGLTPIKDQLVFEFDIERWYEVAEWCQTERRLFSFLYALSCAGVLAKVSVKCFKNGVESFHTDLSEGERQLITIRGLCELVSTGSTLFLFDEPSAFMHPSWQDNFVVNVAKVLKAIPSNLQSHFVGATHSPSVINHLDPDEGELFILDNGKLQSHTGNFYGRDVNSILTNYMHADPRPEEITLNIRNLGSLIDQKNTMKLKKY
ncbi:AAA family ATPase [Larkinella rosea]|uniref:Uncharacterized protein n=1 Tax=Larkinella rosea TaxID=2025312 RepID=A0A3P1BSY2_9BACT|nr:AAA family ATPase [Larkinella rosea]RRB03966.1 hypothetical protein EHT25_10565 [Larkinella rosea]